MAVWSKSKPFVSDGGNRNTLQNPPPNLMSLVTFSLAPVGVQTLRVVREKLAVSGNILDHTVNRADPAKH